MVLVCATRGDRGKAGHASVSGAPSDVAAAREQELRDAARIVAATTVPEPTSALVLYDLRACLRGLAESEKPVAAAKPRRRPRKTVDA